MRAQQVVCQLNRCDYHLLPKAEARGASNLRPRRSEHSLGLQERKRCMQCPLPSFPNAEHIVDWTGATNVSSRVLMDLTEPRIRGVPADCAQADFGALRSGC